MTRMTRSSAQTVIASPDQPASAGFLLSTNAGARQGNRNTRTKTTRVIAQEVVTLCFSVCPGDRVDVRSCIGTPHDSHIQYVQPITGG
jgi:hypothetical protein